MEWDIAYDQSNGLLKITAMGKLQRSQLHEMTSQALAVARDKNCHKCLLDYRRSEVVISTIDIYSIMANLEKLGITHQDRVAIVYSQDEPAHHFGETVAHNRGWWANVQYFSELDHALNWLSIGSLGNRDVL